MKNSAYNNVANRIEKIKSEKSLLDYFMKLKFEGVLKFEGKQSGEYFFGYESQRSGSIGVNDEKGLWKDWATGNGGDIIQAVQYFQNKSFMDAVNLLSENFLNTENIKAIKLLKVKADTASKSKSVLTSVQDLKHPALISYINSRGLAVEDFAGIIKEAHWKKDDKNYFGLGFQNINGGYAIRSKFSKGNMGPNGIIEKVVGEKPTAIKFFEGVFDFASYNKLNPTVSYIAVILNSTSNLSFQIIEDYSNRSKNELLPIHIYFDGDDTGIKALNKFISKNPEVIDKSEYYTSKGVTDINELVDQRNNNLQIKR